MFTRILIANRGEIACRVVRTCKRLGIETVAVYSEADAGARHVAEADVALPIGPASATESYLRADRIIEAALASGAQAIHPGYGFLSEKLELIDACATHGITFIGPHRDAIAAMGSKIESKRLARKAGVVCVPGYDGDDQAPATLQTEAGRIGFPLLIKASAGGGGKGMRRVDDAGQFDAMLTLARKEAMASFGDDRVLLEKYIARPRHLEVQLVGDRHGGLVHLFERECSVQRRFQKVIEEAPAHHLPDAVAQQLYAAALAMGRAIGYDNAGTVEFVLDADANDTPYFLEVNTRLQVEHPVTELTTGLDLVEWQLRVAAGEPLPLAQDAITRRGWAIECRLNAEDPEHGFHASLGTLQGYAEPAVLAGVRVDSGLHAGSVVSPYYDAMLAKVIGFGADRAQATERAVAGLQALRVEGLRTNTGLLQQVLRHPAFGGVLTTNFLNQHFADGPAVDDAARARHRLAVAAVFAARQPLTAPVWSALRGFRITAPAGGLARLPLQLAEASAPDAVAQAIGFTHDGTSTLSPELPGVRATAGADGAVRLHGADGVEQAAHVALADDGRWWSWLDGEARAWTVSHELALARKQGAGAEAGRELRAGLPGRVSELLVQAGDVLTQGQPVLTLEAMKLYHTLGAPRAGRVATLKVAAGEIVGQGQLLALFDDEATATTTTNNGE